MEAIPSKEKTESVEEEEKKTTMLSTILTFLNTTMKETTKSLPELMDLPVEILAKIFNFLPSHDIYCGVSPACKRFYEICQDQSLVPVIDLCIKGHDYWSEGKRLYGLRNIEAVCDTIAQSKNLTTLKIKALNDKSIYPLVSTALQECPKLINLELMYTHLVLDTLATAGTWNESEYVFQLGNTFQVFVLSKKTLLIIFHF